MASSLDLQAFSKIPNKSAPATGSRCGRRETDQSLGKVDARPAQKPQQHTSEPVDSWEESASKKKNRGCLLTEGQS